MNVSQGPGLSDPNRASSGCATSTHPSCSDQSSYPRGWTSRKPLNCTNFWEQL